MIWERVPGYTVVHTVRRVGVLIQRAPDSESARPLCRSRSTRRFHIHHLSPCRELINLSTSRLRLRYRAETPTAGYPMMMILSVTAPASAVVTN